MKTTRLSRTTILSLLAATAIAACQGPATSPAGSSHAAQSASSVLPTAPHARAVKIVADPTSSTHQQIAKFWSYGKDAPYEIDKYDAVGGQVDAKNSHQQVTFDADVRLPNLSKLKALRLLDVSAPASEVSAVAAVDSSDTSDTSADPAASTDPLSDTSDDASADTSDETAIDQTELSEDNDLPTDSEAPQVLSGPHHVTAVADDETNFMNNAMNNYTVTDDSTGESVSIQYDQEWTHFVFVSGENQVELDFNPDGTFLVNQQAASTLRQAVSLLEASPVVADASPYSLSLIAARIGRLAAPTSRGTPACNPSQTSGTDAGTRVYRTGTAYRTLSASASDPQSLAFLMANAILKDLVTGTGSTAASAKP